MGTLKLTKIGKKLPIPKSIPNTTSQIKPTVHKVSTSPPPPPQTNPLKKNGLSQYPTGTLSRTIPNVDAAVKYLSECKSIQQLLEYSVGDERTEIQILKQTWRQQ